VLDDSATVEVESTVAGILDVVNRDQPPEQRRNHTAIPACTRTSAGCNYAKTESPHLRRRRTVEERRNSENRHAADGETEYLPVESVDSLYLHGQIDFNTRALGLLNEHNVPLHVFGWKDYYRGSYLPKRGQVSGNTVVEQVRTYDSPERRLQIGHNIIEASIHNMRANLRYYDGRRGDFAGAVEELQTLKESVSSTSDINELRSIEGNARKTYYTCFDQILRDPFTLSKREYNPPTNEANAAISFLNGMVYTTCVSAIRKTALDPTVGYVHAPGERRFTLSLDIADIFKPILADRVLFRLVNRQQLSLGDFENELEGVS